MIPKLVINFIDPSPLPTGGFIVNYRPKGSLEPYFTHTQLLGTPIVITANILANVDYEGIIKSVCATSNSGNRPFKTAVYNNAIGNINTTITCPGFETTLGVSSIKFNEVELLPLSTDLPFTANQSAAFVSNEKGTFVLKVNVLYFSAGTITVTDSNGTVTTQALTTGLNTFTGVTINSTTTFKIDIHFSC